MGRIVLELPEDVENACRSQIDGTEFESVNEYVEFIVKVLAEDRDSGPTSVNSTNEDVDKKIQERLESLGYLK